MSQNCWENESQSSDDDIFGISDGEFTPEIMKLLPKKRKRKFIANDNGML